MRSRPATPGVLALAPAVLIALLVSRRRYPGARLLVAHAHPRGCLPRGSRPRADAAAAGRRFVTAPRGGLLLARSLANGRRRLLPAR